MFENIIGQKQIVGQLKEQVKEGRFPSSVLFYGNVFTGKQTAALETARVLLCEEEGKWICGCPACRRNRRLDHPSLILTGPAPFLNEIKACGDVFRRQDRKGAAYLFLRAVNKLIRRFDPTCYEVSDTKDKKIRNLIAAIDEELSSIDPEKGRPEQGKLEKTIESVIKKSANLAKEYPKENIPVSSIRNIISWVHTTGTGGKKVVIIENCEKMADGSRNALLKILEEPPKGVYFICSTTKKGLIIPTIVSRLRQYHFPKRSDEEEKQVLEKIFGEQSGEYPGLEPFFLAWMGVKVEDLHAGASRFFELLKNREEDALLHLREITETVKDKESAVFLLKYLMEIMERDFLTSRRFRSEQTLIHERWNREVEKSLRGIQFFNQQPGFQLENLFITMRTHL